MRQPGNGAIVLRQIILQTELDSFGSCTSAGSRGLNSMNRSHRVWWDSFICSLSSKMLIKRIKGTYMIQPDLAFGNKRNCIVRRAKWDANALRDRISTRA